MTGLLIFSCAGREVQIAGVQPAPGKPQRFLIRKDLLQKKADRTVIAVRDLFSPQNVMGIDALPSMMPKEKNATPDQGAASGETQTSPMILHYIGYSYNQTKQKFVALIFFEEQVTPVQEGDLLIPGWRVMKITAKELEIEGPDKKLQTFSREGEQR
jgi:hypothetical protein